MKYHRKTSTILIMFFCLLLPFQTSMICVKASTNSDLANTITELVEQTDLTLLEGNFAKTESSLQNITLGEYDETTKTIPIELIIILRGSIEDQLNNINSESDLIGARVDLHDNSEVGDLLGYFGGIAQNIDYFASIKGNTYRTSSGIFTRFIVNDLKTSGDITALIQAIDLIEGESGDVKFSEGTEQYEIFYEGSTVKTRYVYSQRLSKSDWDVDILSTINKVNVKIPYSLTIGFEGEIKGDFPDFDSDQVLQELGFFKISMTPNLILIGIAIFISLSILLTIRFLLSKRK